MTGEWSQLLADGPAELAEFALNLGLLPEWVRAPGTPAECYDVGEVTRRRAIAAGAAPISHPRGTSNVIATKTLQASALDAAGRGWHVFPLRAGTKVPAVKDWEHEATTDPEQITTLWTAGLRTAGLRVRDGWFVPEPRNLGIVCGPSGLVVLDLDIAKSDRTGWDEVWRSLDATSGEQVLTRLAEQAGRALPDTYTVSTPSGGRHLYFTAPDGGHVRNSAGRVGPMIDVRGEGGYVVAPGSRIHPHYYEPNLDTVDHGEPGYLLLDDLDPATLPDWIAHAATAGRNPDNQPGTDNPAERGRGRPIGGRGDGYGAAALRGEVDRVRSAPVGRRNHTLNAAAYSLGQLVATGTLDHTNAVEALTDAAQTAGLTAAEIAATIDSGLTAGAKNPRMLPRAHAHQHLETVQAQAGLNQPEQVVADRHDRDRAGAGADISRVFGLAPGVAVPILAGLIIDAPAKGRPVVFREAAGWIARLVDEDGVDGQYAVDALSAAARRVGMTRTEIDSAVAAGFTRAADSADLVGPAEGVEGSAVQTTPIRVVEQPGGPSFRIEEVDAAYAGFLFGHAWEAISDGRTPCFPADTLRIACEGEGLPTLGTSNLRDRPRTPAPFVPAPGEELLDKEVFASWSQAQQDDWHLSQPERAAAGAAETTHLQVPEATLQDEPATAGSAHVGPGADGGGSALGQPVDADALVRVLLETLQTRGVIDRAASDATVVAVADQSAAAVAADGQHPAYEAADQPQRPEGVDLDADRTPAPGQETLFGAYRKRLADIEGEDGGSDNTTTTAADRSAAARVDADEHPADGAVDQAQLDEPLDRSAARPTDEAPTNPTPEPSLDTPGLDETPMIDSEPSPPSQGRGPEPHQALDEAIGQARAAVDQLGSARADHPRQSRDAAADAVRDLRDDRPAYWAESGVDL